MGLLRNRRDEAVVGSRYGETVATVSKRWFAVRDSYGVAIAPGEDDALILAVTVCIDTLSHPRD